MKTKVAIFFGGSSEERDVSIMSAASIGQHIDRTLYDVVYIGFDQMDVPYRVEEVEPAPSHLFFSGLTPMPYGQLVDFLVKEVDVVFPVIHGPGGEDGQLQGFLKRLGIPCVGAEVTASAVCMDKRLAKEILGGNHFRQAPFYALSKQAYEVSAKEDLVSRISHLRYPLFVKPSNLGSSIGISKVTSDADLIKALEEAFQFDRHIVIEQGINCREIEVGVVGNRVFEATVVGEVVSSHEFYDYTAKYSDECPSAIIIPADLPQAVSEEIRKEAIRAYELLGIKGYARIDFLVDNETMVPYLSEINTLPGFTKFSMFPLLCAASGTPYQALITRLIDLSMEVDR